MKEILIDDNEVMSVISECLSSIADASFKVHQHPCYHCGLPNRYPIIARKRDIDDFRMLMESAHRVMNKYNITGNLLAEIVADCHIAIAKKKAMQEGKS